MSQEISVRVLEQYVPIDGRSGKLPGLVPAKWANPPDSPEAWYHVDIICGNPAIDDEHSWRVTTYPFPGAARVDAEVIFIDPVNFRRTSQARTVFVKGMPPVEPVAYAEIPLPQKNGKRYFAKLWRLRLPYPSDLRTTQEKFARLRALRRGTLS